MSKRSRILKKRCIRLLLTTAFVVLIIAVSLQSFAGTVHYLEEAKALNKLGLLSGNGSYFDLESQPSREEAAAMFVKLIGKGNVAIVENNTHPFTDVSTWASPYVGYMYHMEMTNGIGNQKFGSKSKIDAKAFSVLLLKALDYSEQEGDFTYASALESLVKYNIVSNEYAQGLKKRTFLRDDMVHLSFSALKANLKGQSKRLVDQLVENKSVLKDATPLLYGTVNFTDNHVLPDVESSDQALAAEVCGGLKNYITLNFIQKQYTETSISGQLELLLPKQFVDEVFKSNDTVEFEVNTAYLSLTADSEKVLSEGKVNRYILENSGALTMKDENSLSVLMEEKANYYQFKLNFSSEYTGKSSDANSLRVNACIDYKGSYAGTVYLDNIIVNKQTGETLIKQTFDGRYGLRGNQNVIVDINNNAERNPYSHGLLQYKNRVGVALSQPINAVCTQVVMDGTSSNQSNYSGLTITYKNTVSLPSAMGVEFTTILPKKMFATFKVGSVLCMSLDVLFDDEEVESKANCIVQSENGRPVIYQDGGLKYTLSSSKTAPIVLQEKSDCYVITVKGSLNKSVNYADKIWLKGKFSSQNIAYTGELYYTDIKLTSGSKILFDYDPGSNNRINDLYSPTTNGIVYSGTKPIYGYSGVSFVHLNL